MSLCELWRSEERQLQQGEKRRPWLLSSYWHTVVRLNLYSNLGQILLLYSKTTPIRKAGKAGLSRSSLQQSISTVNIPRLGCKYLCSFIGGRANTLQITWEVVSYCRRSFKCAHNQAFIHSCIKPSLKCFQFVSNRPTDPVFTKYSKNMKKVLISLPVYDISMYPPGITPSLKF